ncbi:MAG: PKD domain-containing protein, partial [Cyclobacteriaceae bacterium]|nr:PKD domain-containing protein [Cyclobacteriaceae bacterium]
DNTNVTGESLAAQTGNVITNTLINTTGVDQVVVYTVTPTGTVSGCLGDNFTVTVTVKPEPVGIADSFTTCSDVASNYNLINNVALLGNNVGSTFAWIATANPNVTGESTTLQSGAIITDVLNNVTNSNSTVTYTVTPTGVNGCTGSSFVISLIVKPEPVGTSLMAPTVCSGSPVNYNLQGNINLLNGLTTNFTWIAAVNPLVSGASVLSAQTTSTITDVLVNNSFTPQIVIYTVTPNGVNGCAGDAFTVSVTVNPKAQVTAGPDLAHCSNISSIALQGGITYAPNGVIWTGGAGSYLTNTSETSDYSYSNPSEINQTLVLTLTANDPDGAGPCLAVSDQMNLKINPLPTVAIFGLASIGRFQVPENLPDFQISGSQSGGSFSITPGTGLYGYRVNPSTLFDEVTIDPNAASIYDGSPASINAITYTFTDNNGCTNSKTETLIVNALTVVDFGIQGATTDAVGDFLVCNLTGDIELIPFTSIPGKLPETGFSSSTLTLRKSGTTYFIQTDGLAPGRYDIQYTYKNPSDVVSVTSKFVKILASPTPSILAASNCIAAAIPLSGSITFPPVNPYPPDLTKTTWNWNFGDNISQSGQNVTHVYGSANIYTVTLNVRTSQGCVGTATQNVRVGDVPNVDFDWSAICTNDQTNFKDLTTKVQGATPSGISSITNYTWDFGDGDVLNGTAAGSVPPSTHGGRSTGTYKQPKHNYVLNGTYTVKLSVNTDDGCFSTLQRSVFILPGGATVQPTAVIPYNADFNGSPAGWIPEGLKVSSTPLVISPYSWQHGQATGATITPTAGNDIWWTGLNSNSYYTKEQSVVNGPCFDLTQLERPMVALDYWSDSEENIDGAVLQYSTDGGFNWQLVGPDGAESINQGINWYNEKGLPSNPGQNSSYGWTGKQGKWKNARYNLDIVPKANRAQVRVRVAFGSNDGNESSKTYDGFAFDNFFVGEKKRIVLMEHFTNSSLTGSITADDYINDLYKEQIDLLSGIRPGGQSDFNQIQYHISYSSSNSDQLNADNPNDPNTRAANYGVSQPPRTFMDGIKNAKFDGTFTKLNKIEVDRRALKDPKFTLKLDTIPITVNNKSNYISVKMTITADTIVNVPLIAQVALVEDDVATTTPNRIHKNVLRKLLLGSDPTKPDGITISTPFVKGDIAIRPNPTVETQLNVPIKDWTKLKLIGFIQDKVTGEIYQSTILKLTNKKIGSTIVGVEPEEPTVASLDQIQIYPNPANGKFNFAVPSEFPSGHIWKISDQRGIVVMKGDFNDGANGVKTVDISGLINGVYFVLIGAEG